MFQKEGNRTSPPDLWSSPEVKQSSQLVNETGAISGYVTQAPGGVTPIEGVTVWADKITCPYYYASGLSESDGYYIIEDLPDGKYWVYTVNDSIFVDGYWNDKPDEESADTVSVASNDTTEDINFALRVGGTITGTVTLPGASSVSVTVSATNTTTLYSYWGSAQNLAGNSATYTIKGLPTGSYKVLATDDNEVYAGEYYNDKPDWASANPVSVTEGSTTSNINFTLTLGGKITGTVTLPGASVVMVSIYAKNTSIGISFHGDALNFMGNSAPYEVIGLPTGTYKVNTYNFQGYVDEYWDNKPDEASADPISVTAGSTTSGKNFTLDLGAVIAGNISGATKGPLEDIVVWGNYSSDPWSAWSSGSSDASGDYSLFGLWSGRWKIYVQGDSIYAWEWYNNKNSWDDADSVLVAPPDTLFNKDFILERGGSIIGHVYGEGKPPISGVDVIAFPSTSDAFFATKGDTTSADGSYKIGGLRTGWYKVMASWECGSIYYNNKPTWATADSVWVTMPNDTGNINFNMPSAVEDEEYQSISRPVEFELKQNYPNPFNPETKIKYTLKKAGHVTLRIYNILGEKVKTLLDEAQSAGFYQINWDGKNEKGKSVSSGLYFYKLEVNGFSQAKRMLLLK